MSGTNLEVAGSSLQKKAIRVVCIGGGTGLSTILQGLKKYTSRWRSFHGQPAETGPELEVTAIVTVSDDGGSSGRLRRQFDILPPGDIRNCLVALSEDEALLTKLFQYRFTHGHGLKGHSFGNLFLTALTQVTGDFVSAVKFTSEVLAIAGRIYPSTTQLVSLRARLANGQVVEGETRISRARSRIVNVELIPHDCRALPEAVESIRLADLIVLGPGSLFTSVVPNLLVRDIAEALIKATGLKVYLVNLMQQRRETLNFSASDHVRVLLDHAQGKVVDVAVINTGVITQAMLEKYAKEGSRPVDVDLEQVEKLGVKAVTANLVQETTTVRHDPARTAALLVELASRHPNRATLEVVINKRSAVG